MLDRNFAWISLLSHECYMRCSSHHLSFSSFPSTCISRLRLQNSPQCYVILGLCTCLVVRLLFGVSCIARASTEQPLGMVTTPPQVYKRTMYYVRQVSEFPYLGSIISKDNWGTDRDVAERVDLLAPELFFYLAHPVYKMWIIQEPNRLELWNKLHFEEEKTDSIHHV